MNISWLTLRDLEYLVAVAHHEHFGKAAQACHISQPALSAQIKKIEDFLEVKIFERSNRRVVTTPLGLRLAKQARLVLEEAEKIKDLAFQEKEPLSGPLRLGAIATLGPYFIPHFLGPLKKAFPKVVPYLKEGLTEDLLNELRTGTLDVVLASPPFTKGQLTHLKAIPLFVEPLLLALPKSHPLTSKHPLKRSDLKASEMVLLEDGHCLKDQTLEACSSHHRGNPGEFQATGLETLRHLVAAGLGYTLIPYLAVQKDSKLSKLLTYRSFEEKDLTVGRTISLVFRERFSRPGDIEALEKFIKNNLPKGVEKNPSKNDF